MNCDGDDDGDITDDDNCDDETNFDDGINVDHDPNFDDDTNVDYDDDDNCVFEPVHNNGNGKSENKYPREGTKSTNNLTWI